MVRRLFIAFVGLVAVSTAPAHAADVAKTLTDLEQVWVAALVKGDTKSLDQMLAATYVDGDEAGGRSSKAEVLGVLKSGDLKLASITASDMKVYPYGNAAIVTGTAAQDGSFKGHSLAPKIVFTDTFVKQGGKWRAVASQRTTLPGK
ncbi:MAG TPA: nuclear transport factor 2 family protein [Stellaceae bacterium]|nr:nuclear transport factor 2 family protein [Stellaceae bacterium]